MADKKSALGNGSIDKTLPSSGLMTSVPMGISHVRPHFRKIFPSSEKPHEMMRQFRFELSGTDVLWAEHLC